MDTRPSDDETTATGTDVPVDGAPVALTDEERGARLAALTSIIELMRPAVQADGGDLALVMVADADEHLAPERQRRAGGHLRFGIRYAPIRVQAHDFAGRTHFR